MTVAGLQADPVNMIFWGSDTAETVETHLEDGGHTDWGETLIGDKMRFDIAGTCVDMDEDFASESWLSDRHHIRIKDATFLNPLVRIWTQGSAHYETVVTGGDCGLGGHVVELSGFNNSRDEVKDRFLAAGDGHTVVIDSEWGNDEPSIQCDTSQPRSDGKGLWIQMPPP